MTEARKSLERMMRILQSRAERTTTIPEALLWNLILSGGKRYDVTQLELPISIQTLLKVIVMSAVNQEEVVEHHPWGSRFYEIQDVIDLLNRTLDSLPPDW